MMRFYGRLRRFGFGKVIAVYVLVLAAGLSCSFASGPADTKDGAIQNNPPICPRWAFEPWVWEDNENTQKSVTGLVEGYLARDIPVGAVIVDSPWETYYNSFVWDANRYPQPQKMVSELRTRGVRTIMWITGYVNVDNPEYGFVKEKGYAVDGGRDYGWWKGKGVHIDFTNPRALKWWQGKMNRLLAIGIGGWKVDVGEQGLGDQVETYIGTIPKDRFKSYYYGTMIDRSLRRNPEAVIIARPWSWQGGFGASVPKCTIGWCGDFTGDWAGLVHQIYNLYRSARADYGVLGVEVGGFMQVAPNKRQLLRYAQFGAMMPVMNNGGANGGLTNHLPWYHDQQTVDIYRYWATLHSELGDYLFSSGVDAHLTGRPVVRDANDGLFAHRLGEAIFVSVITSDANDKTVAFPADGWWIDFWGDQSLVYKGGSTVNYFAPLERYPVFVKAGAIIPMNVKSSLTGFGDPSSAGRQTIAIFPAGESRLLYHMPIGDGIKYSDVLITVSENNGTIGIEGSRKADYRLRVKAFEPPAGVSGADKWYYDAQSKFIIADKSARKAAIKIQRLRGYAGRGK